MSKPHGRPRDRRIDSAVLDATAELLVEVGYANLTLAAIADRAGTSRPALYRRWPSKAHLVHEAAFSDGGDYTVPETGSFVGDLRAVVATTAGVLSTPLARLALPGLVAEAAEDHELHQRVLQRFADQGWSGLEEWAARARQRGDLADDVVVVVVLEMVIGAALAALLIHGPDALDDAWVDATTRILAAGVGGASEGRAAADRSG